VSIAERDLPSGRHLGGPSGLPSRGPRGGRRGLRPVGAAVGHLRRRLAPPTLLAAAQQLWPEAAGEQIAEQSEPVAERAGTLTVACRSAVWASELTMLAPALLNQLNSKLGEGRQVLALRFVARPS
jgi:predicted nucleic acid-binding Zn ribbon protein